MSRRRFKDDSGAAMIVTALVTTVMLVFTGLGVDYTNMVQDRRMVQGAADATVLAAVQEAPVSATMLAEAVEYAAKNLGLASFGAATSCGTNTSCYTAGGFTLEVETPYSGSSSMGAANQIRAQICHSQPAGFTRVIGTSTLDVCARASAGKKPSITGWDGNLCALCLLGTQSTPGFVHRGGGRVSVTGGSIVVNSTHATLAMDVANNGTIIATPSPPHQIKVSGGFDTGSAVVSPAPTTQATPVPDPLIDLEPPNITGPIYNGPTHSGTLYPGIYHGQITSGSHLTPGVYVLTNPSAIVTNDNDPPITGDQVMLYFTCTEYGAGGYSPVPAAHCPVGATHGAGIDLSAGGVFQITPPTSGPYQGLSFFADRNNTRAWKLAGHTAAFIRGTFYAKNIHITMAGGSTLPFKSVVIAKSLAKTGGSMLDVVFDPTMNHAAVGGTSGGEDFYLLE